jgi:sugar/nucleoside kinase (ribokinase family)
MFRTQLDMLAIGDTTIDAFIRLQDAKTHCDLKSQECELCVKYGQKVPYESVTVVPAVGNASNAAVSGARLGLTTALVAVVGDDQNGKDCIERLRREKVSTAYVKVQRGTPTNYHYVLWYESERTILIKHQAYRYEMPHKMPAPKWVYLSSLGEHAADFHDDIAAYLEKNPGVKLAFQPGTFQMKLGYEKLRDIYAHTEVFFCNKEEAQLITGSKSDDFSELLSAVRTLGPKIAVITDGPKGAYASDGTQKLRIPIYPDRKPPFERTGAGDAFASTVIAGLIVGLPLERAVLWGPVNSMSVVEHIGAQEGLLTRPNLEQLLTEGPAGYKASEL